MWDPAAAVAAMYAMQKAADSQLLDAYADGLDL
jgi:hypothetical protein